MKKIPLSQGYEAIVDDDDYDRLVAMGSWKINKQKNLFYAVIGRRKNKKHITSFMHRIIMNAPKGLMVDHVSGDGLDNQKSNLRFCTRSQNQMNRGSQVGASSCYKGVSWDKQTKRWRAKIRVNGLSKCLGRYKKETEAADAYDVAAIKFHGEFARPNLPNK